MPPKFIFYVFLFVSCTFSCSDSDVPHDWSDYRRSCIVNAWMDDYMDGCGRGDRRHFKPIDGTNMLKWRFRSRLEIFADSTATYTLASPEDPQWTGTIQTFRGTWHFDTDAMTLSILGEDKQILYGFLVDHVGEDFLYLAYDETGSGSIPK